MWALIKTKELSDRRWSIVFGVLAGIGMLTKWTFPFFPDSACNLVRAKKLEECGGRDGDCSCSRGVLVHSVGAAADSICASEYGRRRI